MNSISFRSFSRVNICSSSPSFFLCVSLFSFTLPLDGEGELLLLKRFADWPSLARPFIFEGAIEWVSVNPSSISPLHLHSLTRGQVASPQAHCKKVKLVNERPFQLLQQLQLLAYSSSLITLYSLLVSCCTFRSLFALHLCCAVPPPLIASTGSVCTSVSSTISFIAGKFLTYSLHHDHM